MKIFFFLVILNIYGIGLLRANSDTLYPEVGKPCPEFLLKNVAYYQKKEVTLKDFKGKWLVLDFWNKYCISCVESFPKINAMQKNFGDRVQFVLVAIQDPEGQINAMYKQFQKKLNLKLPCAFDSALSNYWGIITTPHLIIIDDKGIVQAVTYKVDSTDILKFLKGEHPILPATYYAQRMDGPDKREYRIPFDGRKPFMINQNGAKSDSDFLFRSVLTKYNQTNQHYYFPVKIDLHSIDSTYRKGMFQTLGCSLKQLYLYAYFGAEDWGATDTLLYGKYFNIPILNVDDSSLFQASETANRFCYSLILPAEQGTKENLQIAMQQDLKRCFGFDVSIEVRKVPCWRLIANEKAAAILKTKGGYEHLNAYQKTEIIIPHARYKFNNMPLRQINSLISDLAKGIVLDQTGIIGNVDITLDCIDFDELKASLRQNGLDLIPAEKEMKVLVIHNVKHVETSLSNN